MCQKNKTIICLRIGKRFDDIFRHFQRT